MRERIIRVLLNHPEGPHSGYRLAKLTDSSHPWVYELLNRLQAKGLVEGTTVTDFSGLIEYWRRVRLKPERREYMHRNPLDLLEESELPYALTTYQAENLIQYYLFPSRTDFYVKTEDMDDWHRLLVERGLAGKGNVRILSSDDHVFYQSFERKGLRVVSVPQLIADLLDEGGVCVEAAHLLLEKVERDAVQQN